MYSFKFERTESLLNCGGRVGYAAEILRQGLILAKGAGFDRFLAVCDKDNLASEKVILKNGGIREDKRCDKEEQVFVKRFGSIYKNTALRIFRRAVKFYAFSGFNGKT